MKQEKFKQLTSKLKDTSSLLLQPIVHQEEITKLEDYQKSVDYLGGNNDA